MAKKSWTDNLTDEERKDVDVLRSIGVSLTHWLALTIFAGTTGG